MLFLKGYNHFGMQIFRTDENGEIRISVNHKGRILVKKFIEEYSD